MTMPDAPRPPAAEGVETHWTEYPWYDDRGQLGYLREWSNDLAMLLQDEIIEDDVPQEALITDAVKRLLATRPAPPITPAAGAALETLERLHRKHLDGGDFCIVCDQEWPCDVMVAVALARTYEGLLD
jgi:hypothetical protein